MINEVAEEHQVSFQSDSYINWINDLLKPRINPRLPLVVDLFAGCGGLSLGFEAQGFPTIGFENNTDATSTYSLNLQGECHCLTLKDTTSFPSFKVLIGGPPCQPFSVGGKQKGLGDKRDGFPIFTKAVEIHQPDIFLIENVRGLLYKSKPYLEEIVKEFQSLTLLGMSPEKSWEEATNELWRITPLMEKIEELGWASFKPLAIVEAVKTGGEINVERRDRFLKLFQGCSAHLAFINAFESFTEFKKIIKTITWETHVWLAENPTHLIHFNGDKYWLPPDNK